MRIGSKLTAVVLLILLTAGACATNGPNENNVAVPDIKGPALVMFYTDN